MFAITFAGSRLGIDRIGLRWYRVVGLVLLGAGGSAHGGGSSCGFWRTEIPKALETSF